MAIVLVVAGAGAGAYFLFFTGGPATAKTPEVAVRLVYQAVRDNDCKQAFAVLEISDPDLDTEPEFCSQFGDVKDAIGSLNSLGRSQERTYALAEGGTQTSTIIVGDVTAEGEQTKWLYRVIRKPDGTMKVSEGDRCLNPVQPEDRGVQHLEAGAEPPPDAYSSDPPTSGVHAGATADSGTIYQTNPGVPTLVHTMEHGGVIFWHSGLSDEEQKALEDAAVAEFDKGYYTLVVTPHEPMGIPIALTGWGFLLECATVDADAFASFVEDHYAQGETTEARAACTEAILLADRTPPACQ